MNEKRLRFWIALGFGAVAFYYFIEHKKATAQLTQIQPLAPGQIAQPTALQSIPQLRGSLTS
ncbi:MAG: hypothetical protein KGJ13_10450 [Patescibacteria group bacterium]|nr:hypothetical protein [Patescibacteria group bacterium]